jgi:hypothetical protein
MQPQFYDAAVVMVNAAGMRVEQIQLQTSPFRPPRTFLRVQDGRYLVAYCRSVDEFARHVDLATLARAGLKPRRSSPQKVRRASVRGQQRPTTSNGKTAGQRGT